MARRLAVPFKPGDAAFGDRHRKCVAGHDLEAYRKPTVNLQAVREIKSRGCSATGWWHPDAERIRHSYSIGYCPKSLEAAHASRCCEISQPLTQ